jgi:hypothetical protein
MPVVRNNKQADQQTERDRREEARARRAKRGRGEPKPTRDDAPKTTDSMGDE